MTSHYSDYDLRFILQDVRFRIEMLELAASISTAKPDSEVRKLIEEARVEETVLVEVVGMQGKPRCGSEFVSTRM